MPKRPALHPPPGPQGLLDAVRLMGGGWMREPPWIWDTNKSFDPMNRPWSGDLIRARIPKKLERRSCLQTDIKMQEYDGGGAAGPQHDMDHGGKGPLLPAGIHGFLTGTEGQTFISNSIIGYVHRWYDGGKVSEMFGAFQARRSRISMIPYSGLAWSAGAYEKEQEGRPGVEELRREYWAQVWRNQMVGSGKAGPVPSDRLGQDGSGREAGVTPWGGGFCPACPLTDLPTPMKLWGAFPAYCGIFPV